MKNKKFLILSLIILAVGFAAVSTTLYISGKTLIGINNDDFEVYFSSAVLDDVDKSNELISNNKKEIDFTTSLTKLNETSELEFEITNASTQYDADVSISCILSSTDYLSFTTDKSMYEVKAQTRETGLLTVKLDKVSTNELNQTISCTLVATAKELSTAADVVLKDTTYQITGTGEPNTTYVVYSETPHIVTTDDYGFFYVSGLEKGSHEIYYLGDTSEDLISKTKDEIKSIAVDKANITTSSTSINFANGNELSDFDVKPESQDRQEITINLDANGGTVDNDSLTINQYTKVSDLEVPKRSSNYQFDGWYNGDKMITNNTIITSDMDIQAKWIMLCEYENGKTWNYSYTGNVQTFSTPCDGTYKLEVYGAQGGTGYSTYITTGYSSGGKGGYSAGNINLSKNDNLNIYVGSAGSSSVTYQVSSTYTIAGGYNGGGTGRVWNNGNSYVHNGAGGGGATDIRMNGTDLIDRILIAGGGGGGGGHQGSDVGGTGGGANTAGGNGFQYAWDLAEGGQLNRGGTSTGSHQRASGSSGGLGYGGAAAIYDAGGGGGGGYYGGAGGEWNSGGGGSGYANTSLLSNISGQNGVRSGNGYATITLVSID